jgi:hypothetical protein
MMDVSFNLRYGVRAQPTVGLVERQGEIDWLVGGLRLGKRRYMSFWADLIQARGEAHIAEALLGLALCLKEQA